jgi:hypothetical protein
MKRSLFGASGAIRRKPWCKDALLRMAPGQLRLRFKSKWKEEP